MTFEVGTMQKRKNDLTRQAVARAMANRWAEAVKLNRSILDDFPNDLETYNRLGKALSELGRNREARQAFERALSPVAPQPDRKEEPGPSLEAGRRSPGGRRPGGQAAARLHRGEGQVRRDLADQPRPGGAAARARARASAESRHGRRGAEGIVAVRRASWSGGAEAGGQACQVDQGGQSIRGRGDRRRGAQPRGLHSRDLQTPLAGGHGIFPVVGAVGRSGTGLERARGTRDGRIGGRQGLVGRRTRSPATTRSSIRSRTASSTPRRRSRRNSSRRLRRRSPAEAPGSRAPTVSSPPSRRARPTRRAA